MNIFTMPLRFHKGFLFAMFIIILYQVSNSSDYARIYSNRTMNIIVLCKLYAMRIEKSLNTYPIYNLSYYIDSVHTKIVCINSFSMSFTINNYNIICM